MELQKFIEDTLKQITNGLHNGHHDMLNSGVGRGIRDMGYMEVEFDIALTTSKESNDGVGGKVAVLGGFFSVGGKVAQRDEVNNASRIKFTVPVYLQTMGLKTSMI
jgi:hypothetical protein